jgi:acetyl esterase
MPIDPTILTLMPELMATGGIDPGKSIAERRADINRAADHVFDLTGEPGPDVASVVDHEVPVAGGSVLVRVYHPSVSGLAPAHLYLHGGAWWQGTIDGRYVDATCRERCAEAACVVATVEYRLAPEYPFPTPVEDCYAALAWLFANAATLGIDAGSVSVGGASAGGNLAAAVALLARDRGLPPLVLMALEVPAVDLTMEHCSDIVELGGRAVLAGLEGELAYYVREPEDRRNPLVSPLLATSLGGLPPALIATAEYDFLRGDGEAFAAALEKAGVPVRYHSWPGHIHPSLGFTKLMPSAREWRAELIEGIRTANRVPSDR